MQQGGGQGGQLPPQILADQLTLSQPGGADYAHHSTTCPPGFLTLAASLESGLGFYVDYVATIYRENMYVFFYRSKVLYLCI